MNRTPRILLIDDEPDLLELLARRLSRASFDVHTALGGEQGIDRAATDETGFDLVICDINMPGGLNGFDVHARLRERLTRWPLFYFLTGHGEGTPEFERAQALAPDVIITKPLNAKDLVARVRSAFGLSEDGPHFNS